MWLSAWRGKTVGVDQPLQALLLLVIGIATANLAVWGLRFWQ
jgi:hypothetical protein